MATAAKVLDRSRFEARARIADILALGLLVVVGFSLMVDMYALGNSAADAGASATLVFERDAMFVRMLAQTALITGCLGWIAFRLFTGAARRSGGRV